MYVGWLQWTILWSWYHDDHLLLHILNSRHYFSCKFHDMSLIYLSVSNTFYAYFALQKRNKIEKIQLWIVFFPNSATVIAAGAQASKSSLVQVVPMLLHSNRLSLMIHYSWIIRVIATIHFLEQCIKNHRKSLDECPS